MSEKFNFDYKKHKSKKINTEMLDKLMDDIISAGTSQWASIVAGIKIVVFFAYLWARKRIIDEEFLIAKQDYEQSRGNSNSNDINSDDLDS